MGKATTDMPAGQIEAIVSDQAKTLRYMEEESRQLSAITGFDPETLLNILNNRYNFSQDEWDTIQHQKHLFTQTPPH